VDRTGIWASIEERAGVEPWDIGEHDRTDTEHPAPTSRRKLNLRVAVCACLAVVLVAAATVGSLEAANYLAKDEPILVISDITDDTLEPATAGEITQTTVTRAQSWQTALAADDDRALFETALAVFTDQDTAGAQEVFAEDANLYWNFSGELGGPLDVTAGIDEISALVADYPSDVYLYGDSVYTLDIPADKEIHYLTVAYKGVRFIYAPVRVGRDLFMCVLELRDGKIQNQYVEAMF
jgi:hypothetical protein